MTTTAPDDAGHARYTYRLRVSNGAVTALEAEWSRCRWIWYASFVVPASVDPLPATGGVIGIDWGVKETAATRAALTEMGRKHRRDVRLVNPAHTTMDCAECGARTRHALPLSERTYSCIACGVVSRRDKNSARVMLLRAGLGPAGVEDVGPPALVAV